MQLYLKPDGEMKNNGWYICYESLQLADIDETIKIFNDASKLNNFNINYTLTSFESWYIADGHISGTLLHAVVHLYFINYYEYERYLDLKKLILEYKCDESVLDLDGLTYLEVYDNHVENIKKQKEEAEYQCAMEDEWDEAVELYLQKQQNMC